ncbi:MAG: 30S ribosomal protein S7 [Candidatus Cloacimonadales bacterium]|jgi:small subunit ribosomal protein S7|nr:30S ribosomal protein S7 [Candidatus Cloacimonadota bacterium]MDD2650553.1 30S ribosomal protein S7 [Candidatus Cloacimonadota bacterium]MDX9977756.1 30S ribosomal protein S7 [Candidatus Cloacimonadales bacterium]
MARKGKAIKREILPDPKYNSVLLSKFINCVMKHGEKSVAEKIVYGALDIVSDRSKTVGIDVFTEALHNVRPLVKVVSRRVGGSNYQIPIEVTEKAGIAIAFRWIISASRNRSEKSMKECLAAEILSAYKKEGTSVKKREDTHKMAEANKAFAHLRW